MSKKYANTNFEIISGELVGYCGQESDIKIPNEISSLGPSCFSHKQFIKKINIPNSVKYIQGNAFTKTGITKISIPKTVKEIGNNAFSQCYFLESVYFSEDSKCKLGDYMFYECTNLKILKLPENIDIIPCGFLSETGIESLELPKSVKTISSYAFFNCSNLKKIYLNSVNNIGKAAFFSAGLESITIPKTVISLPDMCFGNCQNLKTVTIYDTLEFAHINCFSYIDIEKIFIHSKDPESFALLMEINPENYEGILKYKEKILYVRI